MSSTISARLSLRRNDPEANPVSSLLLKFVSIGSNRRPHVEDRKAVGQYLAMIASGDIEILLNAIGQANLILQNLQVLQSGCQATDTASVQGQDPSACCLGQGLHNHPRRG